MRRAVGTSLAVAAVAALAAAAPAAGAGPRVSQLVVFPDGRAAAKQVSAAATEVRVKRRTCAVASGTPLAALVRSRPGAIGLRDFGACSSRARDGGGLFVSAIGPTRNRGQNGWVYKVGTRNGTAGVADPSGPFGRGRLRAGARVTWFYCELSDAGCQRTLVARPTVTATGVSVAVTAYNDRGEGLRVPGATVRAGGRSAVTGEDGVAALALPPGSHRLHAERAGLVRSFTERVRVP